MSDKAPTAQADSEGTLGCAADKAGSNPGRMYPVSHRNYLNSAASTEGQTVPLKLDRHSSLSRSEKLQADNKSN